MQRKTKATDKIRNGHNAEFAGKSAKKYNAIRKETRYWVNHKTRTKNLYCEVKNKTSRHAESEGTCRSTNYYSRHLIQA